MYVFVGRLYSAARWKQKEKKKSRQESVKNMKREMDNDNDNNSNIIPWNLPVKTFYIHTSLSFSSFLFSLVVFIF